MPLPVDILFLRTHAHKLVIPNPRAPFKLNCRGVRDLLFGLRGIPAGDFNRAKQLLVAHCISNFRLFKRLRTLGCPERQKTARFKTATLLFSARSALFSKNTRVGGYPFNIQTFQPSNLATDYVSQPSNIPTFQRSVTLPSSPLFSIPYVLFCVTDAPQLFWNQFLAHSFYRHGGVYPFRNSSLCTGATTLVPRIGRSPCGDSFLLPRLLNLPTFQPSNLATGFCPIIPLHTPPRSATMG
jgi:hypothetical protein